ncbi:MAG: hypothetical protein JRJ85_24595, partial [Deltaproteobacteria bacterium]|nr:hypothetical protein [Deltaproteobacteria bacterium]
DALKKFNMNPKHYDSQAFGEFLKAEWDYWKVTLKQLGVVKKIATPAR